MQTLVEHCLTTCCSDRKEATAGRQARPATLVVADTWADPAWRRFLPMLAYPSMPKRVLPDAKGALAGRALNGVKFPPAARLCAGHKICWLFLMPRPEKAREHTGGNFCAELAAAINKAVLDVSVLNLAMHASRHLPSHWSASMLREAPTGDTAARHQQSLVPRAQSRH